MEKRKLAPRTSASEPSLLTAVQPLVSVRPLEPKLGGRIAAAALVLRLAGAGLLAWIGYVHWLLWHEGYKFLPVNGPLFLVNAIAAIVLAVALLTWPRALVGLLSAGFAVVTIAALVVSLSVGLFGFRESIQAHHVVQSLVIESITVVVIGVWTVIAAGIVPRRR
jgi:hypothetical protein